MIDYKYKFFNELTPTELYEILSLRERVFLIEQEIHEVDLDGLDTQSYFLLGGDPVIATCRVLPPAVKGYLSIGRVAVDVSLRGAGVGRQLMEKSIQQCHIQWPDQMIKLSAQAYLERFYLSLGFEITGETYLEAGIPHLPMVLR